MIMGYLCMNNKKYTICLIENDKSYNCLDKECLSNTDDTAI
jgi:hypothetical protein